MSIVPEFVTNALEKLLFRSARIVSIEELSGHFRLMTIGGPDLIGANWIPGQKVQFHLGNLVTRTYTPFAWNAEEGMAQFLVFLHGNGPGAQWAASLGKGDLCQFLGPRSSLNFDEMKGPVLLFGDETSIGAALALMRRSDDQRRRRCIFEVSSVVESEEVLRRLGLTDAKLIQRSPDEAHLSEATQRLREEASRLGLPSWVFTGKAQSIQAIRKLLRSQHVFFSKLNVKPYWAYGKTGLD